VVRDAANGEALDPRPAGARGEPGQLVAALWRLELRDEETVAGLERELVHTARLQRARWGTRGQLALRSLDRPGRYLHLSCWRSFGALLGALHAGPSCAGLDRLARLAEVEPGQAVGVGLLGTALPLDDTAHALLVEALLDGDFARFELDFGALAGQFMHDLGFGGVLLLRSTTDPRAYLGILWWTSPADRDDAFTSPGFHTRHDRLRATTARLTIERATAVPLGPARP